MSPAPHIAADDIRKAVRGMANGTGRGADSAGPAGVKRLPDAALCNIANFLSAGHITCAWPWQLLVVAEAMPPKPKGGDRGIGLSPWLSRLWAATHGFRRHLGTPRE